VPESIQLEKRLPGLCAFAFTTFQQFSTPGTEANLGWTPSGGEAES